MNVLAIDCPECMSRECTDYCGCPGCCEPLTGDAVDAWVDFAPLLDALNGAGVDLRWAWAHPASNARPDFSVELLDGLVDVAKVGDKFVASAYVRLSNDPRTDDAGNGTWEDIAVSSDPWDIISAATALI